MNWQVFSRPEAANDVIEIADWYDSRDEGLGDRFIEEFLTVVDALKKSVAPFQTSSAQEHSLALSEEFSLSSDL